MGLSSSAHSSRAHSLRSYAFVLQEPTAGAIGNPYLGQPSEVVHYLESFWRLRQVERSEGAPIGLCNFSQLRDAGARVALFQEVN